MAKAGKCAWCGRELPFTKNKQRLKQHTDGKKTCPGAGQLWTTHQFIHKARTKE